MSILTQPQARIPVGYAMVNGVRVPVEIDIEWARFLFTLAERAGGITGSSTTELSTEAFEDAGIEEAKAALYALADSFAQAPLTVFEQGESLGQAPLTITEQVESIACDVASLSAQIAELTKAVQGIQPGLSP